MLQEIFISNFVLIDELRIQFNQGLNVLTGETGAGKSIIIDALGLIVGDRIKNDMIRDAKKRALVEAVFDITNLSEVKTFLKDNGLLKEEDNLVIISREILPNGRSMARINGRNINISMLRELAGYLLDMHLQHDSLNILKSENYISYVDSFSSETSDLVKDVKELYAQIKTVNNELVELKNNESNKLQKIDFLTYQIAEIEKAQLKEGEEEELTSLISRIKNAKNLIITANKLLEFLYSSSEGLSAYDQISYAIDAINEIDDDYLKSFLPTLEEMYYNLQDMSINISNFKDSLDFEPTLLDEMEDRLHEINKLKSKYGATIKDIIDYYNKAQQELDTLENSSTRQNELELVLTQLKEKYMHVATILTQKRKEAALLLESSVNKELSQLNMPHLKFAVKVEPSDEFSSNGIDIIDFMFSPNPGEPLKPLSKIASGGEISRFILALKKSLAKVYEVPTFIFDEIDVGVGGTSLSAMARKLSELSKTHQVILVTHSPQIASYAYTHFLIEKHVKNKQTYVSVKQLNYNEKLKELARMLGGDNYSEITLKHAGEMLDKAILES